jgi:GST-like protein
MLEEVGLPYNVIPVNLGAEQQFTAEFTALNPNRRIPVIIDHDVAGGPLAVFESGAILIYLAEKTGKLLPTDVRARAAVLQWLMFQMSAVGPMLGQAGHFFNQAPEKIPYAIQRFTDESLRILGVLEQGLTGREYLGGDYSIADIATYPWIVAAWKPFQMLFADKVAAMGKVQAWLDRVGARPAVQRGMAIPKV